MPNRKGEAIRGKVSWPMHWFIAGGGGYKNLLLLCLAILRYSAWNSNVCCKLSKPPLNLQVWPYLSDPESILRPRANYDLKQPGTFWPFEKHFGHNRRFWQKSGKSPLFLGRDSL